MLLYVPYCLGYNISRCYGLLVRRIAKDQLEKWSVRSANYQRNADGNDKAEGHKQRLEHVGDLKHGSLSDQ